MVQGGAAEATARLCAAEETTVSTHRLARRLGRGGRHAAHAVRGVGAQQHSKHVAVLNRRTVLRLFLRLGFGLGGAQELAFGLRARLGQREQPRRARRGGGRVGRRRACAARVGVGVGRRRLQQRLLLGRCELEHPTRPVAARIQDGRSA